jgi:hypothetical protein
MVIIQMAQFRTQSCHLCTCNHMTPWKGGENDITQWFSDIAQLPSRGNLLSVKREKFLFYLFQGAFTMEIKHLLKRKYFEETRKGQVRLTFGV